MIDLMPPYPRTETQTAPPTLTLPLKGGGNDNPLPP